MEFEVQLLQALCERRAGARQLARRFKRSPLEVAFVLRELRENGLAVESPRSRFAPTEVGRAAVDAEVRAEQEGAA